MRLHSSILSALVFASMAISCGDSPPASPTPTATTPPVAGTRIITVTGDLAFGYVDLGLTAERTFTISNSGDTTLTFTTMTAVGGTGTAGYSAAPMSGTVAPGASQIITLSFSPTVAQYYSNVLTVTSDWTSGNNQIVVSGTGVADLPLYVKKDF